MHKLVIEFLWCNNMSSILDIPGNRIKLLKAGFSGKDIEWLAVHVFDNNIETLGVNWLPEAV